MSGTAPEGAMDEQRVDEHDYWDLAHRAREHAASKASADVFRFFAADILDVRAMLAHIGQLERSLAAREAEVRMLRGLMNEWEHQGSTRDTAYRDDLCERWLAALAAPPPGDGAGGGGTP